IIEEENGNISVYCTWVKVFGMGFEIDMRPLIIKLDKDGNFIEDLCDSTATLPMWFDNGLWVRAVLLQRKMEK
ncbi:MAG: hypothetical protein Q8Q47_07845, partial [Ignavibacteriaceae bacterium]|nr:hypothetical protein [Ignavibacteriaceae bacterium]